jgi:hypothetical protein
MSSNNIEMGIARSAGQFSDSAQIGDAIIRTAGNYKLLLQAGTGNSAITVDVSNNVGLGIYSPVEKLDVLGFIRSSQGFKLSGYNFPIIDVSGNFRVPGRIDICGNVAVSSGKFTIDAGTGNTYTLGNLDVSGNSDISGTVNIGGKLTVDDNVLVTGKLDVLDNFSVDTNVLFVDVSNNRVGINNGSPLYALDVGGTARIAGNLIVNGTTTIVDTNQQTTEQLVITNDGTGPAVIINQTGAEAVMDVQDDGTSVFYVADGGNVGLGTTSPTSRLDVNGTSHFVGNLKADANIDTSGNLQVAGTATVIGATALQGTLTTTGATSLRSTLDVSGNTRVFGTATVNNDMYCTGSFDLSQNLRINANRFVVDSAGNADMSGNLTVNGALTGNGGATITGNTQINGNLGVSQSIDVSQNLRVAATKFTVDSNGNMKSAGAFDLSNNFTINTNKFTVSSAGNVTAAGTLDVAAKTTVGSTVLVVDVSESMVGINKAVPDVELDVSGNINTTKAFVGQNDVSDNAIFGYKNLNKLTEFAITQTNQGKTIINCKDICDNTIDFSFGGAVKHSMYNNGNVVIQGNIFTYSDARLKTNVETIANALDTVGAMRGVTYTMIADGEGARKHVGLIAQEVEEVVPEAITEDKGFKTVAYGNLVALLIEAVKELKAEVAALKAQQA